MAEKAKRVRVRRAQRRRVNLLSLGKKVPRATRIYHRCEQCGRVHGYLRFFRMCRICVRFLAREGKIAGLRKSSW